MLNTYWSYQATPQIKLYNLDIFGTTQQVDFKSEYVSVSLEGPGQSDGDIIGISSGGCHIRSNLGPLYKRINEKYPQIWFGSYDSTKGVALNTSTIAATTQVRVCWVPSAVQKFKEIDEMNTLYNYFNSSNRAIYELTAISTKATYPEIYFINPPPENPVLIENTDIKFGSIGKMRPSAGGRIEISELYYSNPDHTSYTEAVKQFITFDSTYCSGTTKNIKYLYWGDYFSLKGMPADTFNTGYTYKLSIYSNSFTCCGDDTICSSNMLFGTKGTSTPLYNYFFTYQDFSAQNSTFSFDLSKNSITINTNAIKPIVVNGSNGFSETSYFIGLVMNLTNCNGLNLTYTHPTEYLYILNSVTIKDIDLSKCPVNTNIIAHIKFYKVLISVNSARWATSQYYNISIGSFGCHSDCLTCNGPLSANCLSCNVTSSHKYYSNGECLTACIPSRPYIYEEDDIYENVVISYTCLTDCPIGYYATNYTSSRCVACNSYCKSCTSNDVMSCTACSNNNVSAVFNAIKHNLIVSPYLFNGMCQSFCPYNGTILTANQDKSCIYIPSFDAIMPKLKIEVLGSKQRVNKKKGAKLKVTVVDDKDNLGMIKWSGYPPEDEAALSKIKDCDSCFFYSYSGMYLYQQSVLINQSAFNRTTAELPIRVMAKGYNSVNSLFSFDMIELYPDIPPPIDNVKDVAITVASASSYIDQKITILPTLEPFEITITDGSIVSEWPTTLFRVDFEVISYYNGTVLSTTPSDFYIMPTIIKTLCTQQRGELALLTYKITNITLPPLLTSVVTISNSTMKGVRGKLRIFAENEFFSYTDATLEIIALENYAINGREDTIIRLSKATLSNWDDGMYVSNMLTSIIDPIITRTTGLMNCYSSSECGVGICIKWECKCIEPYYGVNCQWKNQELLYASSISHNIMDLITIKVINDRDFVLDHRNVGPLCNLIIGALSNNEMLDEQYIPTFISLADVLTSIDKNFLQLLTPVQVYSMINATSKICEFILYKYKAKIINIQASLNSQWNSTVYADEANIKENFLLDFSKVRNDLYSLLDKMAVNVFSTDIGYTFSTSLFCAFVTSDSFENLIAKSIKNNEDIALKCPTTSSFIILPLNMWDKVSGQVDKREIKFRFIEWVESPLLHSKYNEYVDSSVVSAAIYDISGNPLPMNDNIGLIYVMQRSTYNKGVDMRKYPKCLRVSTAAPTSITKTRTVEVNVNQLPITDEQKKLQYPLWDSNIYKSADLIIEETQYYNESVTYLDYTLGTSDYLFPVDFANDSMYYCQISAFSEVAVVYTALSESRVPEKSLLISTAFSLLDNWYKSIGFYTIVIYSVISIILIIIATAIDAKELPKLELRMEDRRVKLSEKAILNQVSKKTQKIKDKKLKKKKDTESSSEHTGDQSDLHDSDVKDITDVSNAAIKDQMEDEEAEIEQEGKSKSRKNKNTENTESKVELSNVSSSKADLKDNTTTSKNDNSMTNESKLTSTMEFLEKKIKFTDDEVNEANEIFSPEYQKKKIETAVEFKRSLLNGYLICNTFTTTSLTSLRSTRAALFCTQILTSMFWISVLLTLSNKPLNQPDEPTGFYAISTYNLWIPFITPILTEFLMYMYCGITFVSAFRVVQSRNIITLRNQIIDLKKERGIRLVMAYSVIGSAIISKCWFIVNFSAGYGWEHSSNWLWTFFLSLIVEYGIYDVVVAIIQQAMYKSNERVGINLYNLRSLKWGTMQE